MVVMRMVGRNGWKLTTLLLGGLLLVVSPVNLIGRVEGAVRAAPRVSVNPASGGYCTPANVANFSSRIHVKCAELFDNGSGANTIQYFAVPSTAVAYAARTESLMSAAFVSGHKLYVFYDASDLSGTSIGCGAADCRLLTGIVMVP